MTSTDACPRFARMYRKAAARADQRGGTEHRKRLLAGLKGTIAEVGAGHGLNFTHYPSEVSEVIAFEPEANLRSDAEAAARSAPVPVTVKAGVAEHLPLEDESVDAVIASLVLCSVPEQAHALAEMRRVVRPGGELRFYEHVVPLRHPKRALLQLADHSGFWPALAGGCHPARDTVAAIQQAGFSVESCERFDFRASAIEPSVPHVLGVARRD
jgi:ubiquinone/menaquinone biosynthesis C-methylase UbiE